jgi:DNA-binding NarL/FixJ family response regulator
VLFRSHAGKRPLSPEIAQKLADRIREPDLTAREVEVLTYLARGLRNKEIATFLGISEQTTQTHLRNIYAKLRVNDRTSAAFLAAQQGIIHLHEAQQSLGRTLA